MDIPGFFYNPVKKKYFKIQKNHLAPRDSEYSHEAVIDRQLRERNRRAQHLQHVRERRQRLSHDPRIYHPLTSIQLRLGNSGPGNTTSHVAEYYGAALRRCPGTVVAGGCSTSHFAVSERNHIVCGISAMGIMMISNLPLPLDDDITRPSPDVIQSNVTGTISSLLLVSNSDGTPLKGLLAWAEISDPRGNITLRVALWGYGIHSHIRYNFPREQTMHLTASPSGTFWLAWTTSGTILVGNSMITPADPRMLDIPTLPKKDDLLTVAFKDDFIIMTGHRSGSIYFCDHREPPSFTKRLVHDSSVNALMCLKDDHIILVNGLISTKLYDLRHVAAPTERQRYSEPLLTFSTGLRISDRLGLGLDYYRDLNIIAMASSQVGSHHVTLYSTRTGKVIPSAINHVQFDGAIPCLKFAVSQDRPRSLVMIPEVEHRKVVVWSCI